LEEELGFPVKNVTLKPASNFLHDSLAQNCFQSNQCCNWVATADLDDPLTWIAIRVRPGLIKSKCINPAMIQAMGVAEHSSKAAKSVSIHVYTICDLPHH